ncbi:MAG: heavy metal translocating P-type ATPase [Candidatus Eisenbacteria bacterium]
MADAAPTREQSRSSIAVLALVAIAVHLALRYGLPGGADWRIAGTPAYDWPLGLALGVGGLVLVLDLVRALARGEFTADVLAGISIVTAVLLGEYLAGALVVLMLSGGQALEARAVRSASGVLEALARRSPSRAHRKRGETLTDIALEDVAIDDRLEIFPHETCPVDGIVVEGHGTMDESYLTGEPYVLSKAPGSRVLSGAINGSNTLTIRAEKLAVDSRYAKIMQVMRDSEERRPRLRRLGDRLGAIYTPIALAIAAGAWIASGDVVRFLSVLVIATPCPLLIAIPVAVIGSISLAARRGIILKDPAVLENIDRCKIALFDKTGTLTYGQPQLTEVVALPGFTSEEALAMAASLERYSRHPLAAAVVEAGRAAGRAIHEATEVDERPGEGLRGIVDRRAVTITGRAQALREQPDLAGELPEHEGGMEAVVLVDGRPAALLRFRDEPRADGSPFIRHLMGRHGFARVLLVSGDRASEVEYLAQRVGITEVYSGQSPEQKLALVRELTKDAPTVFLGDGINDAPALTAATVGIAFGQGSDITSEAAGAVILDSSLQRVDELLHIGRRMRAIALQSAVGGMALSVVGMGLAATGHLPPVAGAIAQEGIDLLAILNALRVALPPKSLSDYRPDAATAGSRPGVSGSPPAAPARPT